MGIRANHDKRPVASGGNQAATDANTKVALEEQKSSVVSLTSALVQCDDHLDEIQNENANLRARNAALEVKVDASAAIEAQNEPGPAQALEHCGEELSNAQDQNQRLLESNTALLGLVRERSDAMEEAQRAADHDVVTELPNRRMLPKRLRQAIAQAKLHHQGMAVVMLDLDGFKHINDRLGHPVGERLLQALARRICTNVGGGDSVCHYGGVQFVLILPDVAEPVALDIVESITQQVAEPCTIEGHAISVTVSTGVALYPRDGRDVARLLQVADKAMCLHKPRRDQVPVIQTSAHAGKVHPSP